jgi:hypothetical protein
MIGLAMMLAVPPPYIPFASGPPLSIAKVERAARRCGMRDVSIQSAGKGELLLSVGRRYTRRSLDCTLKWKRRHRDELALTSFLGEPLVSIRKDSRYGD